MVRGGEDKSMDELSMFDSTTLYRVLPFPPNESS